MFLEVVANNAGELVVPVDDVPVGLIEDVQGEGKGRYGVAERGDGLRTECGEMWGIGSEEEKGGEGGEGGRVAM